MDFCARTVITADPSLDIDQVGVPTSIAKRLTKPIVVTPFNIADLQRRIRIGPNEIGGALYVRCGGLGGGTDYDLAFVSLDDICRRLAYGDVVERMLMDGDWVAMNRTWFVR